MRTCQEHAGWDPFATPTSVSEAHRTMSARELIQPKIAVCPT